MQALPPGFVLEEDMAALPPGFVLEEELPQQPAQVQPPKDSFLKNAWDVANEFSAGANRAVVDTGLHWAGHC